MTRRLCWLALALALAAPAAAQPVPGLKVPPGFVVTEFAGDDLAHDISTMTLDSQGRVVVAGRGYIKLLLDDNNDGKADRAVTVADTPKGYAMGLLWEGDTLYVVGDQGLNRFKVGPDGKAVGPSELVYKLKATGEHDAHAIRRGGDGWLYWLCGNNAGVSRKESSDPKVREPVAGALSRFSPDFQTREIVATGFRNPFDFDFGADGEPYTFDSDNERCIGLPWYEGCRFYRVGRNEFYGWLNPQRAQAWRWPPYFADVARPLADLGRGSPTGVACYRHRLFPERYRGGFFLGDWTFGRLWFVDAKTFRGEPFLEASGDTGFAPTALAVHSTTGELFVSIGGRGTRGGVYRIGYPEGRAAFQPEPLPPATLQFNSPNRGRTPQLYVGDFQGADRAAKLRAVRLAQRQLGDLGAKAAQGTAFEGYSRFGDSQLDVNVVGFLRAVFPWGDAVIDRELSRALAMVEDEGVSVLDSVVARWTPTSDPVEDVHYLIVAARLKASRKAATTQAIAGALVGLDRKYVDRKLARDRNWPLRLAEVHAELAKKDAALNAAVLAHPDFARPGNVWLTRCPGFDKREAAERYLAASSAKDFAWTGEVVALLAQLPSERYRTLLPALWERGGLDDELLDLVAGDPKAEDRGHFLDGLRSPSLARVERCLGAIEKLPVDNDELVPLVRALRSLPDGKAETPVRERLAGQLRRVTGQTFGPTVWPGPTG